MDLKDIQSLLRFISKTDLAEVSLKTKEFEIKVKTQNGNVSQGVQTQQVTHQPTAQMVAQIDPIETKKTIVADDENSAYVTFKSPMIGTFYRKPSPDKPSFANVGDEINKGEVVCIIEAMKLFNEIESDFSGRIVKILVEDSSPVEFDQPLFLIDPS